MFWKETYSVEDITKFSTAVPTMYIVIVIKLVKINSEYIVAKKCAVMLLPLRAFLSRMNATRMHLSSVRPVISETTQPIFNHQMAFHLKSNMAVKLSNDPISLTSVQPITSHVRLNVRILTVYRHSGKCVMCVYLHTSHYTPTVQHRSGKKATISTKNGRCLVGVMSEINLTMRHRIVGFIIYYRFLPHNVEIIY